MAKPTFSHREKEILELLVAGMTNRQIGDRLYLSESTVKTHVTAAFAKLGVRSRKDAAAILLDPAEGLAPTALPSDAALPRGRAVSEVGSHRGTPAPGPRNPVTMPGYRGRRSRSADPSAPTPDDERASGR